MNKQNILDLIDKNINEVNLKKAEISNVKNVNDLVLQILALKRMCRTLILNINQHYHEYDYYANMMFNNLETIFFILSHQDTLTIDLKITTDTILEELLYRLNNLKTMISKKG